MSAAANSRHFSWSLKLCNFIMVNVLDALDDISLGNYRLNIYY